MNYLSLRDAIGLIPFKHLCESQERESISDEFFEPNQRVAAICFAFSYDFQAWPPPTISKLGRQLLLNRIRTHS